MKSVILVIIFCLIAFNGYTASFDCSKATTLVENAICSDSQISDLDELLMRSYKKTLANSTDGDSIKSQQKAWLKNVRNKCQNSDCIKRAYQDRIVSLNNNIALENDNLLWQGEWNRINSSKHDDSGITITKQTSQGFDFLIDAASGGNSGQIEGSASFIKKNAFYKDSESGCVVKFKIKDKCIELTTQECSGFGGMGVYFDGKYCKGEQQTQQASNHFIDMGIFKNNAGVDAFKEVVGNSYDLFEESFQLTSEEKDMDNFNATVATGGVSGLFTIMEGIIMQCPNGKIYAAVIDGDTVKFFSNDPLYSNKLPITIEKWRERFKDKKVIFFANNQESNKADLQANMKANTNADEVATKEKEKQDTSNIRIESISPIPAPLTPETADKIGRAMIPLIQGKDVKNDPVLAREAIIKSFNKYGYNFSKTVENIADDPLYAQSNGAWTGFILAVTPETEEQIKSVYTKEEATAILNLRKAMKAYK